MYVSLYIYFANYAHRIGAIVLRLLLLARYLYVFICFPSVFLFNLLL